MSIDEKKGRRAVIEDTVLALRGVSKRFGAVKALIDVSVDCRPGEIHAVLGENGSGKSTLLGVASGATVPDRGTVEISGRTVPTGHVAQARRLGLAMAYQTYSHVAELTVAENLYLAALPHERPHLRERDRWASGILASYVLEVSPTAPLISLSLAERQFLEVIKALINRPLVLLLDEPTTALGPEEIDRLHDLVKREADQGVGILYVSHRLSEVFEVADRVTVLRDGNSQGTYETKGLTEDDLLALMIGRPANLAFPERNGHRSDEGFAMSVTGLEGDRFGPVDLQVRRGEILGLAGADGNGQQTFLRALAGLDMAHGTIHFGAREVAPGSPQRSLEAGAIYVSGDRLRESLFPVLPVRSNLTVQALERFSRFGILRRRREAAQVTDMTVRLRVRTQSIEEPVRFLSGGNQQKVALGRSFFQDPSVLLLEEPTQGVDVESRFDIYSQLRQRADEGTAIVVRSSDPIELTGLCDRVVVMSRGQLVEELVGEEISEERIVAGIVQTKRNDEGRRVAETARGLRGGRVRAALAAGGHHTSWGWLPLAAIVIFMLAIGSWTQGRSDAFLSEFNLNSLLFATVALAVVSMGQLNALLVKGFDVSVGALMALAVVVGSFWLTTDSGWLLVLGALGLVAVGVAAGVLNVTLIVGAKLPSIIATLATLSIMQGIALVLRPTPGGFINADLAAFLKESSGFLPWAFVGVVVLGIGADLWLYRTSAGLATRAVGFDDTSAQRLGITSRWVVMRSFVLTSMFAVIAAFFLAAQTGVGDARLAGDFALASIAAAVLGGASLTGGRGSFTGAVLGALFLTLLVNILPFIGWSNAFGDIGKGVFILGALVLFKFVQTWSGRRRFSSVRLAGGE